MFHALFLDGIRGYAALIVFYFHSILNGKWQLIHGFRPGAAAVHLFFVLSSFLLTYRTLISYSKLTRTKKELIKFNSDQEKQESEFKKYVLFWLKYISMRVFRIFPLLITIAVLIERSQMVRDSYMIRKNLSAFSIISFQEAPFVFWTIRVEFGYYMIIPAIVIAYHDFINKFKSSSVKWVFYSFCIVFAVLSPLWMHSQVNGYKEKSLQGHIQTFLMGSVAGLLQFEAETHKFKFAVSPTKYQRQLYASLTLFLFIGWSLISNQHYKQLFAYYITPLNHYSSICHDGILISVMILLSLWSQEGVFVNVMATSFLGFFGKISFSLYILHPIVLNAMFNIWKIPHKLQQITADKQLHQPGFDCMILSLILTVLVSQLSYTLIERPTITLTRKVWKFME